MRMWWGLLGLTKSTVTTLACLKQRTSERLWLDTGSVMWLQMCIMLEILSTWTDLSVEERKITFTMLRKVHVTEIFTKNATQHFKCLS